jgi:hypothetical protein
LISLHNRYCLIILQFISTVSVYFIIFFEQNLTSSSKQNPKPIKIVFRNSQKILEREISVVVTSIHDMSISKKTNRTESLQQIEKLITRLTSLKKKVSLNYLFLFYFSVYLCYFILFFSFCVFQLEDTKKEEDLFFGKLKSRLQTLSSLTPTTQSTNTPTSTSNQTNTDSAINTTNNITNNNKIVNSMNSTTSINSIDQNRFFSVKLDRMLVDFMLREGLYQTAISFSKQTHIEDFVDVEIFVSAKKALDGLQQHNCKEALKWCSENKSKLKKLENDLEFSLLVQEFVEIAKTGAYLEAIEYARKSFTAFVQTNPKEIQTAMGLLVFSKDSAFSSRYDVNCFFF